MKRFSGLLTMLFVVLVMAVVAGCGGGGGDKATSFNVTITDAGAGFSNAGQTNLVLLGTANGIYRAESVRAIYASDIQDDRSAAFGWTLGDPVNVESNGVGVFELRVTQGVAGTWKSGDDFDRWQVNGHNYVLGYGPKDSRHPGWSIWDVNTASYVGALSSATVRIKTYFLYRSRSASSSSKILGDKAASPEELARIVAQY